MIAAGTASATAGRKRQRALSQGAAPEDGLGFAPDDSVILGDEKEADLFYDASNGKAADPAAVQAKAQELEALEEELEFFDAEEEEAHSRQHAEARARGVMSMISGTRPEDEEDCNWSVSLFGRCSIIHQDSGPAGPSVAP